MGQNHGHIRPDFLSPLRYSVDIYGCKYCEEFTMEGHTTKKEERITCNDCGGKMVKKTEDVFIPIKD